MEEKGGISYSEASDSDLVENLASLQGEFDAVMDNFSKLESQVEILEKQINNQGGTKEDFNILKRKVDRLETYVHSEDKSGGLQYSDTIEHLLLFPGEQESDVRTLDKPKKVTPTTKRAYELFLQIAKKRQAEKDESTSFENAKVEAVVELQGNKIIPDMQTLPEFQIPIAAKKVFYTAVQAISKGEKSESDVLPFDQAEGTGKMVNKLWADYTVASDKSAIGKVFKEFPAKIPESYSLVSVDKKDLKDLKESMVSYVKKQMDKLEMNFFSGLAVVKNTLSNQQRINKDFEMQFLNVMERFVDNESKQSELEKTLMLFDAALIDQEKALRDLTSTLRANGLLDFGVSKGDVKIIENKIAEANEGIVKQLAELENKLDVSLAKVQDDLDDKADSFDVDVRLEPLVSRLKALERVLKDMSIKFRVLEFDLIRPIDVKKYVHCKDGKPLRPIKPVPQTGLYRSLSYSSLVSPDELVDENYLDKVEKEVRKRMELVIMRDIRSFPSENRT